MGYSKKLWMSMLIGTYVAGSCFLSGCGQAETVRAQSERDARTPKFRCVDERGRVVEQSHCGGVAEYSQNTGDPTSQPGKPHDDPNVGSTTGQKSGWVDGDVHYGSVLRNSAGDMHIVSRSTCRSARIACMNGHPWRFLW